MGLVKNFWRKLTHTKALDQSSGKWETIFFESVYRVTYFMGLSSVDRDIGYLLYSNFVKFMIICLVSGEVWFAFTEASSMDEIAGTTNVFGIQIITVYRYTNIKEHSRFYKYLATSMNSPYFDISTEKRRKLVEAWVLRNERYFKLLHGLGYCTLAAWFTFPLADELEYNHIIGIRLPFYYQTPGLYALAYLMVVVAFGYISLFVMVTDSIMQTHLIHILCQYAVLADCFENLIEDCSVGLEGIPMSDLVNNKHFVDTYLKRLGNLVEQHKLILSNTMNLKSTLSGPMLGQLAASGTLICFVGYQAATTIQDSIAKCLMSFLFLGYSVFELYIICKWCEEITTWSQKIGESIYCSGWEDGLWKIPGVRSTIMFVIARANTPVVFTAGGMYDLSIASYGSLLKGSYSALTVLLRFNHD